MSFGSSVMELSKALQVQHIKSHMCDVMVAAIVVVMIDTNMSQPQSSTIAIIQPRT